MSSLQKAVSVVSTTTIYNHSDDNNKSNNKTTGILEYEFSNGLNFSEFEKSATTTTTIAKKSASAIRLERKQEQLVKNEMEEREEQELFRTVAQHQINASAEDAANLLKKTLHVSKVKKSVQEMSVSDSLELMHGADRNGGERELQKKKQILLTKKRKQSKSKAVVQKKVQKFKSKSSKLKSIMRKK